MEDRQKDLLSKARAAEEKAAQMKEPTLQAVWLTVAESYRILAQADLDCP